MAEDVLNAPLVIARGGDLPNRIAKAAMTEGLADPKTNLANDKHVRLYERWAKGGAGLLITGNVLIDRDHLERPGNVVIQGPSSKQAMAALKAWAKAGQAGGGRIWMQISHAGRQTQAIVNPRPAAPSPVAMALPGKTFAPPRALRVEEIEDLIGRFGHAAKTAREAGFDGIQLHAAHGYLISQFLSPRANVREDEWGGPIENRARFLLRALTAMRAAAGEDFPIAVKLNSADFQKGGFSHADCLKVVEWLDAAGVDLIEVTGGAYEQPKMAGMEGLEAAEAEPVRESTRAREAYFAAYARSVKAHAKAPIMATGGFRTRAAMLGALEDGEADVIGLGRPLCVEPDLPARLLSGDATEAPAWESRLRLGPGRWLGPNSPVDAVKMANGWGAQGWFCLQLLRMGEGLEPETRMGVLSALLRYAGNEQKAAKAREV